MKIKLSILLFLSLFFTVFSFSQKQNKIDSLENIIHKVRGKEKVKLYIELSKEYLPFSQKNAWIYAKKALVLSEIVQIGLNCPAGDRNHRSSSEEISTANLGITPIPKKCEGESAGGGGGRSRPPATREG